MGMSDRATLDNVARALKDFYDRKNASIRDSPAPDHRLPQCEYCDGFPGNELSCVHCGAPNNTLPRINGGPVVTTPVPLGNLESTLTRHRLAAGLGLLGLGGFLGFSQKPTAE